VTEISRPWAGIITGDPGPYSDDQWSDLWRDFFLDDRTVQGVLKGILNELAVSGVVTPVSVATGGAIVDGKWYASTAIESVTIPTPGASTRIDRIVLRKSWSAQTVRVTRIAGVEGGGAPALVQTDGTTWDIPLAQASITTGGAITVTDDREAAFGAMGGERRYIQMPVVTFTSDVSTGDGQFYIHIPADLDGWRVVEAHAEHITAGGGATDTSIQVNNVNNAADIFSTALTIDNGETGSDTAAVPVVIDRTEAVVNVNDILRVDINTVPSTAPQGLIVTLGLEPL